MMWDEVPMRAGSTRRSAGYVVAAPLVTRPMPMNLTLWSHDLIAPKPVAGTALLSKACDIIEIVGRSPGSVGLAVLGERTGIPRATLYRILAALISRGLLRADPATQTYTLGFSFLDLAQNAWSSSDLASIAAVELRRLRDLTGETAYLAVREGHHVLALGRFESPHPQRSSARVGALKPMHCTSQGKAILAHLEEGQLSLALQEERVAFTPKTICDADQLRAHLEIVRGRGYALDDEEIVLGTRCVGAAILDREGRPIAAISVAGPTFRITPTRAEQIGQELVEVARRISDQAGLALQNVQRTSGHCRVLTDRPALHGAAPRWDVRTGVLVWADLLVPEIRVDGAQSDAIGLRVPAEGAASLCLLDDGIAVAVGSDVAVGDRSGLKRRLAGAPGAHVHVLRCAPDGTLWAAAFDAQAGMTRIGPWQARVGVSPVFVLPGEFTDFAFGREETLFAAQPSRQCVYQLERDTGRRRRFADFPRAAGLPRTLAIDANGSVWIGLSEGWSLVKLNEAGEIQRTVPLPIASPTGIAFGGPDLTEILVTSARTGLSRESLAHAPLSGHLLAIDVGEPGLADPICQI